MSNAAAVDPSIDAAVEDVYMELLKTYKYPPDIPRRALYFSDICDNPGILTMDSTIKVIKSSIEQKYPQNAVLILTHFLKKYGYVLLNFLGQHNISWPADSSAKTYNLPVYIGETFFSAISRVYEKLMKPGETVEQFYNSLRDTNPEKVKRNLLNRVIPEVVVQKLFEVIESAIPTQRTPGENEQYLNEVKYKEFKKLITTPLQPLYLKLLFQQGDVVGQTIFTEEASIERHIGRITENKTFDEYAMSYVYLKLYTEIQTVEFVSSVRDFYLTDSKDWRQQIFIIVPTDDNAVQGHTLTVMSGFNMIQKSFNDLATLQFQYDKFNSQMKPKPIQLEGTEYSNIMQIQGFKMYEHAHFLMAVASGIKYASPKARALLPELFNQTSRFAWLDARMTEWATRIQSLPRVEKEIEQRQFEIVQKYINEKRTVVTPEPSLPVQQKAITQASTIATNLGSMTDNLGRGADPNLVYSNFIQKYASSLDPTNIASIKKRKTGFFFGESRKAYQPRLAAQLRALKEKLSAPQIIQNYESLTEMRKEIGLTAPPPLPSGTIEQQIEFLTQQIREIKTQLTAKQSGSGRRHPSRFTRRKRHTRRRRPSTKITSRTRRV